ncbi:MAG: OB-fold putative lipoprotein [Candidatus Omnitrophica bacterium]|nr:OB-fold putative lipoprotein [Candidatus Omnitrophota bacterium]
MKNYLLVFIGVFLYLSFIPEIFAQSVSSRELISKTEDYNGKRIVFQGELVGERMCRRGGCWINVNDGFSAIGVWIPASLEFIPNYTGGYKSKGDWVQVEGVFHSACVQHLGEIDIHAEKIILIKEGRPLLQKPTLNKINVTIFIWGLGCLMLILKKN